MSVVRNLVAEDHFDSAADATWQFPYGGMNWNAANGGCMYNGSGAYNRTGYWNDGDTARTRCWSRVLNYPPAGGWTAAGVRQQSTTYRGYFCIVNDVYYGLYDINGGWNMLTDGAWSASFPVIAAIEADGTSIAGFYCEDGDAEIPFGPVTDSTWASGRLGVFAYGAGGYWDDFTAGYLTDAPSVSIAAIADFYRRLRG